MVSSNYRKVVGSSPILLINVNDLKIYGKFMGVDGLSLILAIGLTWILVHIGHMFMIFSRTHDGRKHYRKIVGSILF